MSEPVEEGGQIIQDNSTPEIKEETIEQIVDKATEAPNEKPQEQKTPELDEVNLVDKNTGENLGTLKETLDEITSEINKQVKEVSKKESKKDNTFLWVLLAAFLLGLLYFLLVNLRKLKENGN